MAARHLSLALALAVAPAAAQEAAPRPEAALEAVAYKALMAQETPPLLEEAAADWKRLREQPAAAAALRRPPLEEKAALVERLLTGILSAERYAALREDAGFRRVAQGAGVRWDPALEWAPGRAGAFARGAKPVTLAELRDLAAEHERRKSERDARWRPPQGDAETLSAAQAESAMEEGRRRFEALRESDPQAAQAMLSSLYDFAGRQRRRDDMVGDREKQEAVNRVARIEQQLRRAPAPAASPAARPAPAPAPPAPDASALRAAFCEAFARLDIPPALTAAAAACSFAQAELRLVLDRARATAALLRHLSGQGDEQRRRRLEGIARELEHAASRPAAERDLTRLEQLQRDADRIIEGPSPGMERSLETLERERVLLADATIREAVAADLLGRVAAAAIDAGPEGEELLRKLAAAPETLSEPEWGRLSALFEQSGAGETQRLLRVALAESAAARAAVEKLYADRPELARYRAASSDLASVRLAGMADGRVTRGYKAGELGLHGLPSFIDVTPGVLEGRRGLWAHRHGRRVFTPFDGSFELTVALGRYGETVGQARRRPGSRLIELSDGSGKAQGAEFELGRLLGGPRPRDAVRAAAEELAAALRRPELGARPGTPAPEVEALASFLERGLAESQGPPPGSASLSIAPDGGLELQLWFEDGVARVHRARFETATDFNGAVQGRALVSRLPYTVRPGEAAPQVSAKKHIEHLADGSIVFWREARGSGDAAGVFSDGRANVRVRLHRAVRAETFGEWREEEAEDSPRETVVETLPDSSLWKHFKGELYRSLTEGDAGRLGRGPVTVGNAVRGVESLLSGLGWAGDKFYHGVVGVGQTDVAMLTGSPLGQLEAEATMARLRGFTAEQAEALVRRLPAEQRSLLDARVWEDRQRDMRARGETMTRLGEEAYQRLAYGTPSDEERARALLERFGAGTYGARAVEEAGRRGGAARYALYAGGAAMQFGEDTARSLPQMLALNALGRLSALRTTGGTALARTAGTGAAVTQVALGRVMQVSGAFGTVDGVASIVDGASHGDWGKVMLNLGSTASDLVDFFGSARELARTGERRRAFEARQRALSLLAGELGQTRARAALSDMTEIRPLNANVFEVRDPAGRGQPLVVKLNATAQEAANLRRASAVALPTEADNVRIPGYVSQGAEGLPSGPGGDLRRAAAGRGEGRVPLVMERATGAALKDFIAYDGEPTRRWEGPPISARDWQGFRAAVEALNAAGVQHGDLRNPENIRVSVDADGRVRFELIDWGGPANPAARLSDAEGLRRLEARLRDSGLLAPDAAASPRERGLLESAGRAFGDRAGRRIWLRAMVRRYMPFRRDAPGSNLDFQGRAMRRFLQDPEAVAGVLDSDLFERQSYSDCAVHSMYNHPSLAPVKAMMPYERFLRLAESAAGSRLREEGTTVEDRANVLLTLGYRPIELGRPSSEGELIARLRSDGSVLGGFQWRAPLERERSFHAVVIAGAIRGTDGTWRYLVADSNHPRYQEFTYAELTDLGLRMRGIVEVTPSGQPRSAAERARIIAEAMKEHGAEASADAPGAAEAAERTAGREGAEGARLPWHRPLRSVRRDAAADGSHLVPPGQSRDNPAFTRPMARATDAIRARAAARLADGRPFTEGEIRDLLDVAGEARRAVAQDAAKRDPSADPARTFGARIPETAEEIARYEKESGEWVGRLDRRNTEDIAVLDGPPKVARHNPYYAPIARLLEQQNLAGGRFAQLGDIRVDGREFPSSGFERTSWKDEKTGKVYKAVKVTHPSFEQMAPMRRHAREMLARAMSDPRISEEAFMDRMAEAYRLLCHATPWVRGSPAAIESTFDALLRAKFGKTLGVKRAEPFWDVMLWDNRKPYTGRDFLANYR